MREERSTTDSAEATRELGRSLGSRLSGGEMILVSGPLGAGKSVLARGVAESLGVERWRGSPTFTLVNEYPSDPPMAHIDLYRLSVEDLPELALEEYLDRGWVLVVEWPERAGGRLHDLIVDALIEVEIDIEGLESRAVRIRRRPASASIRVAGDSN